jgi:hypothetical protein
MSNQTNSSSSGAVNEVTKVVSVEAVEDGVAINITLRPGQNRVVVRVLDKFVFSV